MKTNIIQEEVFLSKIRIKIRVRASNSISSSQWFNFGINVDNKMIEKLEGLLESVVTTNGFTFTYTPSLKVLGVTSPTGGLEIFHQMTEEKANEIVGNILEKHRNRA